MTFGEALSALQADACVARAGWNGRGMCVFLARQVAVQGPVGLAAKLGPRSVRPCLVMLDAQGMLVPGWLASQTDMLADDWLQVSP